ncbi:MAG: carboxypeptidase regulatory-like domain-containing protein, partial [Anaerolineales bacterium]|nr:carboxypeptidase regulatory-like domain-containing protein [Anaerolineales bacterium]
MNKNKKRLSVLGLALGTLVLGLLVGLLTVGTVAADPTPGVHIQIPRVDVGDVLGTGEWETWIQVQNVGDANTGAIFLGWGEYSGLCPTNDPGVIVHYCQLIQENAIWTLKTQIAEEVKSGIIYSVDEDVFMEACYASEEAEGDTTAWRCWLEEWEFGTCEGTGGGWNDPPDDAFGEDLAVTVTRYGPNDYGTFVSSTYTGISEEMEGEGAYPYEYYAPYVMKGYNGLDTEITIQNSGELCTSVWINYMEQGSCQLLYKHHIEQLAPGESVRLKVPCNVDQIPCFWLGSAHIAAEQPLGIIVDETSFDEPCVGVDRGTLLTHRARPKVEYRDGELIEDTKVYADLLFREWSGWDASIQVQNLSRTGQNTFVTVDFMDNSGDEILFLADWVCPGGSQTFYLPIVNNLGFEYVGAAEIQSHTQVNYPGGETAAQPIFAVVDLKKPDDPMTPEMDAQGGSYNAHPYSQKEWVSKVALPFITKDTQEGLYTPWTSMIAVRNNSNCNKIKPKLKFSDETGTIVCELTGFWLHPKHLKMIDLNNIGCLHPGYIGSATVVVEQVEQLCDVDQDGHVDNEPIMPSVIVVGRGLPFDGDVTNIYEGTPYATNMPACYGDIFGTVSWYDYEATEANPEANDPLQGASVWADTFNLLDPDTYTQADTTSYAGGYELTRVPAGTRTVVAGKFMDGKPVHYYPWAEQVELKCGADTQLDILLVCTGTLTGTVIDHATGVPLEEALVELDVESTTLGRTWSMSTTTEANGTWSLTVPLVGDNIAQDAPWTMTISKDGYDDRVTHNHAFADDNG